MTRSKRGSNKSAQTTSDEEQQQQERAGGLKVFPSSYRLATFDVMCGRNKVAEGHRGNKRFRGLVEKHCLHYMKEETTRDERRSIVTHILEQVINKGGYFLKQEYEGGEFIEISIKYAREKIVHSLRDTCLKLQSMMEVSSKDTSPTTPTTITKTKQAVPSKKSPTTIKADPENDGDSLATTQTEESEGDSTSKKADEPIVSEGEATFKSFQSNTSALEGIDECRIRRKRHIIDCKPRKKPKLPGNAVSAPVKGNDKSQKKQASVHRKLGTKLPINTNQLSTSEKSQKQPTPDKSRPNPPIIATPRDRGLEALSAHRALVLAALKAEKAQRMSSPAKMDGKSHQGRIVTPQQGRFPSHLLPLSKQVQPDSSTLGVTASNINDIVKAPSSLFGSGILRGSTSTHVNQNFVALPSSPQDLKQDKKHKKHAAAHPFPMSKRKETTPMASFAASCRSDATSHHRSNAHILEETEDERISCWGEYC